MRNAPRHAGQAKKIPESNGFPAFFHIFYSYIFSRFFCTVLR